MCMQGGSTMFKDFGRRLQRDVQKCIDARAGAGQQATALQARVVSHAMQRYAVWCGGSVLGTLPEFSGMVRTRAEYEERGAGMFRGNAVYRDDEDG